MSIANKSSLYNEENAYNQKRQFRKNDERDISMNVSIQFI